MVHSLTRFAKSISDDVIWIEDPPPLALDALFFDVLKFFFPKIKRRLFKIAKSLSDNVI